MNISGVRGIFRFLISRKFLTVLVIFLAGFAVFGGVNSFFAYTNRLEFCTSCHTMQNNFEEYKETVHYKNASGVRAICSDCHVPKQFGPKVLAKLEAVEDIYHEVVGTIDTKEKFDAHRWEMASRVWATMKATDSRECRSCHNFDNMDFSAQGHTASKKHQRAQAKGKTCIDCHKGIAHNEPSPPDETATADSDSEDSEGGKSAENGEEDKGASDNQQ